MGTREHGNYAVMKVIKIDNGYKSIILNESERGLWKIGEEYFNRELGYYLKDTTLNVTVTISEGGRKMVKKIEIAKESVIKESKKGMSGSDLIREASGIGGVEAPLDSKSDVVWSAAGKPVYIPSPTTEAEIPEVIAKAEIELDIVNVTSLPKVKITGQKEQKPTATSGYYVSQEARMYFSTALQMSNAKPERAVKVMMVGPSGYGKTTLPELFAHQAGKKFAYVNCASIRDPEEWFGFREARDGSTHFIGSEFARVIGEGNAVIVLDEFNRLEPWLHNTLYPLLDERGKTTVHDQEFSVGPGVIVVGTINTGYRYTGVFELDEAMFNRFDFVMEVTPMPHHEERKVLEKRTGIHPDFSKEIVRVSNILRSSDIVCSTRTSLLVANMMVAGLTAREAFETAVVRRLPADSSGDGLRKKAVDLLNANLGVFIARKLDFDIFAENTEEVIENRKTVTPHLQIGMSKIPGTTFLRLQFIQMIRSWEILDEHGQEGNLSLREAQAICEDLESGGNAYLPLAREIDDWHSTIAQALVYGVTLGLVKGRLQ